MTVAAAGSRIRRAVPRLARCAAADPRLFARALGWRLVLPLVKTTVPIGVLAKWMDRSGSGRRVARGARVASVERLLREGGRLVMGANCLERSLLIYRLVSEADADAALVMGVSQEDAGVTGHAWVELDGRPFADPTARNFQPIQVWRPRGAGAH